MAESLTVELTGEALALLQYPESFVPVELIERTVVVDHHIPIG